MRKAAIQNSGRPVIRRIFIAGATLLAALAAALALNYYGTGFLASRSHREGIATASPPAGTGSTSSDAFKFSFLDQPRALPELRFVDADGQALSLADFRGRPILLNIWATWCVPCRKEMPSLDRLQAWRDQDTLVVLALCIDRQGPSVVTPFYQQPGLKALGPYCGSSGT